MAKLKKRVKKKWLEALRSGKYEQTSGTLSQDGKYCCLGVLCEVAIDSGLNIEKKPRYPSSPHTDLMQYDGDTCALPPSVQEWAFLKGKKSEDPIVTVPYHYSNGESEFSLANLNDDGHSFAEIADLIEEHL
jgi:hypothetical protein